MLRLSYLLVVLFIATFLSGFGEGAITDFEMGGIGDLYVDIGCDTKCPYIYWKASGLQTATLTLAAGSDPTANLKYGLGGSASLDETYINIPKIQELKTVKDDASVVQFINLDTQTPAGTLLYLDFTDDPDIVDSNAGVSKYTSSGPSATVDIIYINKGITGLNKTSIEITSLVNFIEKVTINSQQLLKDDFKLRCKTKRGNSTAECNTNPVIKYSNDLVHETEKSLWYAEEESSDNCGGFADITTIGEETLFYGKPMKVVYAFNVPDRKTITTKNYSKCTNMVDGCAQQPSSKKWIKIKDKLDEFTASYKLNEPDSSFGLSKSDITTLAQKCNFTLSLTPFEDTSNKMMKFDGGLKYLFLNAASDTEFEVSLMKNIMEKFRVANVVADIFYKRKTIPPDTKLTYSNSNSINDDYYYTFVKLEYASARNFSTSGLHDSQKDAEFDYANMGSSQWYLAFSKRDRAADGIHNKEKVLRDGTSINACYVQLPLNTCTNKFSRVLDTTRASKFIINKHIDGTTNLNISADLGNSIFKDINDADFTGVSELELSSKRIYIDPGMVYSDIYFRFYSKPNPSMSVPLSQYSLKIVSYVNESCSECGLFSEGVEYVTTVPHTVDALTGDVHTKAPKFLRNSPINGEFNFGFYNVKVVEDSEKATNGNYIYQGESIYPTGDTRTLFIEPAYYFYPDASFATKSASIKEIDLKPVSYISGYVNPYGMLLAIALGSGIDVAPASSKPDFASAFDTKDKVITALGNGIFQYLIAIADVGGVEMFFTLRYPKDTISSTAASKFNTRATSVEAFKILYETQLLNLNKKEMLFLYQSTGGNNPVQLYSKHEELSLSGVRIRPTFSGASMCKNTGVQDYNIGGTATTNTKNTFFISDEKTALSGVSGASVADHNSMYVGKEELKNGFKGFTWVIWKKE